MSAELVALKCEACNSLTPTLPAEEVSKLSAGVDSAWDVHDGKVLRREWKFKNFNAAFSQATAIALLAQQEGHHPDLEVGWGRVVCSLTTHAIDGLSKNDFIMAAKIDRLE